MAYAELAELFKVFAVSLLLGAFIGLERERTKDRPLGIRSFTIVAGLGTAAALIADRSGAGWVLPAAFAVLGALLVVAHIQLAEGGRKGLTTELAGLLALGIGALAYIGPLELAVGLGVATAALLHFKPALHALADRAGERDIVAMVQFGLVAFVVLPVLPDQTFGPYDVLNPHNIWLMVVLVSGINLAGYVALKLVGTRHGGVLSGLLGGLASSTATTFSFSRRAQDDPDLTRPAALAIIVATAVTVPRMAIEIGVVNQAFIAHVALPLGIVFVASLVPFAYYWFAGPSGSAAEAPEIKNPVQIGSALVFGLLYGVITLALAAAQQEFGGAGAYAVSALSGLTDVDAITLSTARLVGQGRLAAGSAVDVIIIAYLSNLVAKAVLAAFVGTRALARIIAIAFGFSLLAGLVVIVAM